MNKTRRKSLRIVAVLSGIIVMLVVIAGITGCAAKDQQAQTEPSAPVSETEITNAYPSNYQIQFEQAWKINQDMKGYLTLEGTALSTNVVQGTDNTFYNEHGFDGGTDSRIAFLDYRANIETPSSQMLIYLPHANNHAKFGELVHFKNLEYYQEHPVISFNSLYRNAKYKVFAVALFPSDYDGIPYQSCMDTNDKAQLTTLVQKAMEHSILDIPVDIRDTDELLTVISEDMSLMDENGNYATIAVFARKVRDGESEAVNTQKAAIKPNSHMPESWYDQILRSQYLSTVNQEIRQEAANWFSDFELSNIADADLERMMNTRKAEYAKYLSEQEMLLSAEEKTYLYEKRVAEAENPVLTLDVQNLTARVGDEVVLNVRRTPQDANATYTWSSSNTSVVSINGNGANAKLTAHKEGPATITVSSGKASATCKVDVKAKEQFVLNPSSMTVFVDDSYNIKASSDIQHATSSNPDVARVSVNKNLANVYGVSPGEATITLTGKNGMSATCKVIIKKYQLTLDKTSLDMKVGNRRNIYVSTGTAANWYVDNNSVVKMSIVENGKAVLVEAIGAGTATVTVTARNGIQASCKITVNSKDVAFSTTQMDMQKGEFREMQVIRGDVVRWEVSDPSVAQVCIYGNGTTIEVEALGYGTATIKAYGSDGSFATLTVNVSAPKESLSIAPYSMSIPQGELRNITVYSGSASNWVSSNPNVAEVYVVGDGTMAQVEGRNPGTATITVYDRFGGWVTCNVTVEAQVAKLEISPSTVYLKEGDWEELTVTSGNVAEWASTNTNVVGIYVVGGDNNNVRIKANGGGTAEVIGYGADGVSSAVCKVIVEGSYMQSLTLNRSTITLEAGSIIDLRVDAGSAIRWSSSDPSVAEAYVVDTSSMVEVQARAAGTATITAYAADGSTASCTVTVEAPNVPTVSEDPLKLNQTNMSIEEGNWDELYVTSGRCVNWNTSNQNVVRIYDVGDPTMIKVKGESAGTAEIIAYAADGTTTVCKVTVTAVYTEPVIEYDPVSIYQTEPTPESEQKPVQENVDDSATDGTDNG